jgi:hypothetical protein
MTANHIHVDSALKRQARLLLDTILFGVVGVLSAQAFLWMLCISQSFFLSFLAGYRPTGLPEEGGTLQQVIGPHGLWLIPVVTTRLPNSRRGVTHQPGGQLLVVAAPDARDVLASHVGPRPDIAGASS